jgi:asparagine synthase (glutamine-hydrolysing)
MCGIAGSIQLHIQDLSLRTSHHTQVLKSLSHRGPDAQFSWNTIKHVALYHSRLSILDLDARANQPFFDVTGRYALVFNGEIYNYQQLKNQLDYPWKTTSDTELLMAWLISHGTNKLDQLDGMFAFAWYDIENESLLLARDRLGKKPLYLYATENNLSFSSELRVLLTMCPHLRQTNKLVLSTWLFWQTIPGTGSLIPGIEQLEPGSFLHVSKDRLTKASYCAWKTPEIVNRPSIDIHGQLRSLVRSSVEKRLLADVPLACFLSGGIDSSIIVAEASKLNSSLNTFNLSFNENRFSEHRIARLVAHKFKTQHHEILLKPLDFLEVIDEGLAATDHPSGDGLNTYFLSKKIREAGFKVALSGVGGDEWFLGYDYFTRLDKLRKMQFLRFLKPLSGVLPVSFLKPMEIAQHTHLGAASYPFQRMLFDTYSLKHVFGLPEPSLIPLTPIHPDSMSNRSVQEWYYYNQPVLLRDSDQFSMAVGLEIRSPFMDHTLVDWALTLPDTVKRGNRPKHLLVESYKNKLPVEVYARKKQGFTLPWEEWLRNELQSFCDVRIQHFSQRIESPKLLKEWKKFQKHQSTFTWSRWWSVVSLEDWLTRNRIEVIE